MIITYELTTEEEEALTEWATTFGVVAEDEVIKQIKRFLKLLSRRGEGKGRDRLHAAFKAASKQDKERIKTLLGL